jgi:hypothetical protein
MFLPFDLRNTVGNLYISLYISLCGRICFLCGLPSSDILSVVFSVLPDTFMLVRLNNLVINRGGSPNNTIKT